MTQKNTTELKWVKRIQLHLRKNGSKAYTGLGDELVIFLGWLHPFLGDTGIQTKP